MTENRVNEFTRIITPVISAMEENAKKFKDDAAEITPYEFVREFRTVHLAYGRRIGKTQYINSVVTKEDFILLPKLHFASFYPGSNIGSSNILSNKKLPTFKTIYVDEPKLHEKLDECLRKLIKRHDQTVIMVGA